MTKELFSKDKFLELRRQAEALLSAKEGIAIAQFDGDPLKLIHELQTHQIELELQNDELRRTQEELAVSQKRYFNLYDLAPVGYITLSEKGVLLETNLTAATLLGKSRNEMIKQPISNFILSMDQDLYYHNRKRLFETEKPRRLELRMVQTDKLHFWAQMDMTAVQNEDGSRVCQIAINDITKRKQSEEIQQDNQKFLDSIIEQSPHPTWISDTMGTMVRANPALKKVLNLSDEQLIGKYNAFEDKQIEADILKVLKDALENGKTTDYELDWVGNKAGIKGVEDGNRVYCEGTMFPIYNQKGAITHAVITYKDVSHRKKAEEALLRNEEELRAIVDHSVDAIGVSQQGIHKLVNPAYLKMFGYQNAKDLIGKSIFELIAPDERKKIKQFVSDRIKGRPVGSHYHTRGLKKDGVEFDMEVNVAQYGQEDIKNTLVILRDVTDRNKLEEQVRQSQKMESIGNLAGGIAHDFNNLLFPIIGMSEMLLEDLPQDSLEYENAQEIFTAGRRAGDLVNQILAFSRQSEHKMSPVRVQNVLKEVLKLSRSTIPANIEIQQNIQHNCGLVMADPTQIHQIGMNLITNAFHAVETQNGTIDIELKEITLKDNELSGSELQSGQYIKLSVSDNGTGMSENTIQKIFEPYFTTKGPGKGTGLGLAVLYGIVKEHNGEINVSSELG
ncbi:MAG: PAS domain S-box protein, partial [Desulfobacteraceae bacterium]|nr:PAS domain S-box protein [Desulfobacteraceae bacterium]